MWSRLDHAAKLYATIADPKNSSTFRLSATLTERIDVAALQAAADATLVRYRKFSVKMSNGIFWQFLARNATQLTVEKERDYPCYPIGSRGPVAHLVRVLYFEERISVEFFHALTDGTGALEFLKTLIWAYLTELGHDIPTDGLVQATQSLPRFGEDSDGFSEYKSQYLAQAGTRTGDVPKAHHLTGTAFEAAGHNVVDAVLPMGALKDAAGGYGVSVTGLLMAVSLKAMGRVEPRPDGRPFIISMPVNLRRVFPSNSLRNFFVVVNIGEGIDPTGSLGQITTAINVQMEQNLSRDALAGAVAETMKFDQSLASRFIPRIIKRSAIRYGFNHFGQSATTMTLSNLGLVRLPQAMVPLVERLDFHLYPATGTPINVATVSYNGLAALSFARSIVEADFIRAFLDLLKEETAAPISVTSNEWGL